MIDVDKAAVRLELDASELLKGLDGDVAVMLALLDRITSDYKETAETTRLRGEIKKMKKRVIWDTCAGVYDTNYALMNYGARP